MHGQTTNIIEVNTDNTAMVFVAEDGKPVVFQYWGCRMDNVADFALVRPAGQQLYPAYGGHHYLNPALRLTHDDGVLTTELVYAGVETDTLDDNRTLTVVHLKDTLYPVLVDVHFVAHKAEDVIVQQVVISHHEQGTVRMGNIASCYFPLHAGAYYLTHFYGSWGAEMQWKEERLTPGVKVIESKKGVRTAQSESPSFLLSLDRPAAEDFGEVYAGALAWSGNYKLLFELDEPGVLHTSGGINDFASEYYLDSSQVFHTPEMVLTYSAQGKGQISRNFHDWSRRYALAHGDTLNPVLLNSWESAYFDFDERTITDMIDHAAGFGIELFVLDDGWFGNRFPRDDDDAGLGDWQVNRTKLPRGIGYLADYAASKGLRFGLFIEPEMVSPKSELAQQHPEWIVKSGARDATAMRNQWLLDMTNPAVQDFVVQTFDTIVALSPNISYIKWDANRHVENVGSDYLPAFRQTHFWYDYVRGLYAAYERIRENHPGIEIQMAASGGGRVDFGALKYHDEFLTSDNTNAVDRIFIQYGTNTIYPVQATASHVSASPNHQTELHTPLKFRFDVAMSARLGMELQPKDISGSDYAFAKRAIGDYKRIRPIVQQGDLYRLISPYDEGGWASLMYVSKDKTQAAFFAYSLKFHNPTYFETKLKGLHPGKRYKITELNRRPDSSRFYGTDHTFSGEYLMKAGVKLRLYQPFSSTILLLSEEEPQPAESLPLEAQPLDAQPVGE
jgi:alpha-galactosidase